MGHEYRKVSGVDIELFVWLMATKTIFSPSADAQGRYACFSDDSNLNVKEHDFDNGLTFLGSVLVKLALVGCVFKMWNGKTCRSQQHLQGGKQMESCHLSREHAGDLGVWDVPGINLTPDQTFGLVIFGGCVG